MALPVNRPISEIAIGTSTVSAATSPVAAYAVTPCKGRIVRTYAVAEAAFTGAMAVAVAVNGGANIGALTVAAGAAGASGSDAPGAPEPARFVNEGDVISFTPSGATGAAVSAKFQIVIERH